MPNMPKKEMVNMSHKTLLESSKERLLESNPKNNLVIDNENENTETIQFTLLNKVSNKKDKTECSACIFYQQRADTTHVAYSTNCPHRKFPNHVTAREAAITKRIMINKNSNLTLHPSNVVSSQDITITNNDIHNIFMGDNGSFAQDIKKQRTW